MKLKRIAALIVLILLDILFMTGCWNYREVNNLAIVGGAAVDWDGDTNKYKLTIEIINPQSGGKDAKLQSLVLEGQGNSIFEAERVLIVDIGKNLFWAHAKIFIINSQIAEKGIIPVIDWLNRDPDARADIWLAVAKTKTAGEIFDCKPQGHDTISYQLNNTLRNESNLSRFPRTELWQFVNLLNSEGEQGFLPAVNAITSKDKRVAVVLGTAVFKKDRMVGWLDDIETRGLLFIRNQVDGGVLAIIGQKSEMGEDVTLRIIRNKTRLKAYFENGQPVIRADIKTDVEISELGGDINLIKVGKRDLLKKAAEIQVKGEIEETIRKALKEYHSDIFGFGATLKRDNTGLWRKLHPEWSERIADLKTQVNVDLILRGSGVKLKPIETGE